MILGIWRREGKGEKKIERGEGKKTVDNWKVGWNVFFFFFKLTKKKKKTNEDS